MNTHTFLVIYADLLELIWILDKSILRRLKSRIDWNLECGIFEKRDDVTEQNQLENQQIWNTNKPWTRKSWTRKSWTTNVSASFFNYNNQPRACVCLWNLLRWSNKYCVFETRNTGILFCFFMFLSCFFVWFIMYHVHVVPFPRVLS